MSETLTTFAQLLAQAPAKSPALISEYGVMSFAELRQRVEQSMVALSDCTGSVAVVGGNHPLWVELYYAVPTAGKLLTLLNHRLSEVELNDQLRRANASIVIGEDEHLRRLGDDCAHKFFVGKSGRRNDHR